jgi:hypothetical protein
VDTGIIDGTTPLSMDLVLEKTICSRNMMFKWVYSQIQKDLEKRNRPGERLYYHSVLEKLQLARLRPH